MRGEVPKRNNQYSNFNTQQPNKNDDNSFKYPKKHMLNMYEPVDTVTSSIQRDYLVNNEENSSLSFLEKEVKKKKKKPVVVALIFLLSTFILVIPIRAFHSRISHRNRKVQKKTRVISSLLISTLSINTGNDPFISGKV